MFSGDRIVTAGALSNFTDDGVQGSWFRVQGSKVDEGSMVGGGCDGVGG